MIPIPILILSDGPDLKTGLGRIGHDLAYVLCSMPEFRVGYLGRQGFGRSKFPWVSYSFSEVEQFGESRIQEAWEDLSQGRKGIIFTIWDASRLLWFTNTDGLPESLTRFLTDGSFDRWGYFMQDSEGVNPGLLPLGAASTMAPYNRICLASKWAYNVTKATIQGHPDIDWLPHGINRSTFQPVDKFYARSAWGVGEKDIVIGCCMTNQERKHWPTVIEAVSNIKNAKLWMHTDRMINYWNLPALITEYGMQGRVIREARQMRDRELAMRYSSCNATVIISGGEGFCYPAAESLSCGCPVVTGSYGAQAELVGGYLVAPQAYAIQTSHNIRRAFYNANSVAAQIDNMLAHKPRTIEQVEHLDWLRLGHIWKRWLRKGLR